VKGAVEKSIATVGFFVLLGFAAGPAWCQADSSAAQTAKPKSTAISHTASDPALLHPATLKSQAPAEYDVKFVTTKGDFVVHVRRDWAPQGADRFYNLVKHHFYDGASFFRFVDGFVVQFGLTGNPAVNKAWTDANIKDDPVKSSNKPGFITFAMAGPNTRTTQVFINLGDNSRLDGMGFAPFGEVTSGMDVVKSFYSGYGEGAPQGRGPDQGAITTQGKAYLDKNFPNLDSIKSATIVAPAGASAAPASKPKPAASGAAKSQ
jgi:peptidyl-prolyl cis-trans isomerase A (cyclophilin A)